LSPMESDGSRSPKYIRTRWRHIMATCPPWRAAVRVRGAHRRMAPRGGAAPLRSREEGRAAGARQEVDDDHTVG
jgi:hypothetical protein